MQGGSMSIKSTIAQFGLGHMIDQVYENPDQGMQTLLGWADKFSKGAFPTQRKFIREIVEDKENPYHPFVNKIFTDLDRDTVKKLLVNYFVYANLAGGPVQQENREKYQYNRPRNERYD
jgi:hypothetical protein